MARTAQLLYPSTADFDREHRAEPVSPEPHRLVADIGARLEQQIRDVERREREAEHECHPDQLG